MTAEKISYRGVIGDECNIANIDSEILDEIVAYFDSDAVGNADFADVVTVLNSGKTIRNYRHMPDYSVDGNVTGAIVKKSWLPYSIMAGGQRIYDTWLTNVQRSLPEQAMLVVISQPLSHVVSDSEWYLIVSED